MLLFSVGDGFKCVFCVQGNTPGYSQEWVKRIMKQAKCDSPEGVHISFRVSAQEYCITSEKFLIQIFLSWVFLFLLFKYCLDNSESFV